MPTMAVIRSTIIGAPMIGELFCSTEEVGLMCPLKDEDFRSTPVLV